MWHQIRFDGDGRAIKHRAIRDDSELMRQMGAALAGQLTADTAV
jgi:hypothetical protein